MTAVVSKNMVENTSTFASKISVLDSVYWIASSWKMVKPEAIRNCFSKAGFLLTAEADNYVQSADELIIYDDTVVPSLSVTEAADFIAMDGSLCTCESPDSDEIFKEIVNELQAAKSDSIQVDSSDSDEELPDVENNKSSEIAIIFEKQKKISISNCPSMMLPVAEAEYLFQSYLIEKRHTNQRLIHIYKFCNALF